MKHPIVMANLNFCAIVLFVFCGFQLSAQSLPPHFESDADDIFAAWNGTHTPGGAVGVVKGGELVFAKAYGMASLEYDVPNTVHTIFNIASVSKQMTAFSMVLLEQQGLLSLDDEVQKHLPEVPTFDEKITIRHLLHHTSGLRNFQNILAMAGWRDGESMTNEDLLRFLSKQQELNFKPGEEYLYCNTGFNICTAIVERLTGETFQNWTKAHIFEPLGMLNSSYREDLEIIHKNTATSYEGNGEGGFRQPLKYWTYMGNGNVYTTIADLTKWLNNFENPTVGGKEGIQTLVTPGVLNNGDKLSYGLGIGVGEIRGLKRYSHGGSVGGYRSSMVYFPDQQLGIIVISNFSSANPGGKMRAIADLLLEEVYPQPASSAPSQSAISTNPIVIAPNIMDPYVGDYMVEGVIVELTKKDDQLHIFAEGVLPAPLPLTPSSDSSFFNSSAGLAFRLTNPKDDQLRTIYIQFGEERHRGFMLAGDTGDAGLLGTYYSPELDTRYTIFRENGQLMAHHQRHGDFKLYATSKNKLKGDRYFFSDISVERTAGKVSGIRVSNGRVRNLWFEKL